MTCKTFRHPFGASGFVYCLALFPNAQMITRKNTNVRTCVHSPAIKTSVPILALLPCQFPEDAIPEPDAWIKNEAISQPTKVLVMRLALMPSIRC